MGSTIGTATEHPTAPDDPVGATGPAGRRGRDRLRAAAGRYGPALLVYGAVRLVGLTVFALLANWSGDFHKNDPRFGGGRTFWDILGSWDGWWYRQIAENGYHPQLIALPAGGPWDYEQNSAAFFPLYPGLMRLVSSVTGLGSYGAGMLVSVVASFAAAAGIFAVAARLTDRRTGIVAAAVWGVFPGSGVEWAVYSDSLFVALAAWACYCILTENWPAAGLITFLAGLNRPTAGTLVAALGTAALISLVRRRGPVLAPIAATLIAPLGLTGYIAWVGWRMGDLGGYFTLQRGAWKHYFDYGRHTLDVARGVLFGHYDYGFAYPTEDLIGLLLVALLPVLVFLYLRLRPPAALTVYTLLTIVMVLGSYQIFGNTSRYLLPAFPLFLPIAVALRRLSPPSLAAVLGSAAVASGWYAGFVIFELGIP
ncbi:glycosyltransferase family 39 protein [Kitasatospora sp. KL5]|uniref:glycosyltransferase family 39 protein n=1 Tax=Kitasatospora sp. KL5 TaxID=3425125 RepID=UPI003D6EA261